VNISSISAFVAQPNRWTITRRRGGASTDPLYGVRPRPYHIGEQRQPRLDLDAGGLQGGRAGWWWAEKMDPFGANTICCGAVVTDRGCGVALFLLSPDASFITGPTWRGWRLYGMGLKAGQNDGLSRSR